MIPDGSHEITTVIEDFDSDGRNEVAVLERVKNDLYLRILDPMRGIVRRERNISRIIHPMYEYREKIYAADLNGTGNMQTILVHHNTYSGLELWAFNNRLEQVWVHRSPFSGGHRAVIQDIDGDGRDEIVLGKDVLDHNGRLMFRTPGVTGAGHCDGIVAMDFNPEIPGLEIAFAGCSYDNVWMMDLKGRLLWHRVYGHDQWLSGGDFVPLIKGLEVYANFKAGRNVVWGLDRKGDLFSHKVTGRTSRIDWDGDPSNGDEVLISDGRVVESPSGRVLFKCRRGFQYRAMDILGDHREEIIESDIIGGTVNIYSNTGVNPNVYPSYWDSDYWRKESRYKHDFYRDYINPFN
jgi:hypothetical protein